MANEKFALQFIMLIPESYEPLFRRLGEKIPSPLLAD